MNKRRKICVVTTTRAEYGLLYWLMREIEQDSQLELQLVVGGSHLSSEFGNTVSLIEQDGFNISEKVEFLLSSDSGVGVAKSIGLAIISFVDALNRFKPDILVLLGDRYEILAVAQAAMSLHIPIAHIHGGEVTHGAIDDSIRHAITKLAHIHFPACERYKNRICQLGENPKHVFNYGAPGLDHIQKTKLLNKQELESCSSIVFSDINILCTYHPETTSINSLAGLKSLLGVLDTYSNATIIFTESNADEGSREINSLLHNYTALLPEKRYVFKSLGIQKYISVAKYVDVVVGNSSSGLIEVPFVKTPTVNVGLRQQGRELADSVICCNNDSNSIAKAVKQALSSQFKNKLEHTVSPYGDGDVSAKIKNKLKEIDLTNILVKEFFDYESNSVKDVCYS